MSRLTPAIILYDASGNPMEVSNGVSVPGATKMFLAAGADENDDAQYWGVGENGIPLYLEMPALIATGAFPGFGPSPSEVPAYLGAADVTSVNATFLNKWSGTPNTYYSNNTQLSVVSDFSLDTTAGGGAGSIQIWYLDEDGNGPFNEIVTLNGTTPVLTTNTNFCTLLTMRVRTQGSQGFGDITATRVTGGGNFGMFPGSSVDTSYDQTYWGRYAAPASNTNTKYIHLLSLSTAFSATTGGLFYLYKVPYYNDLTVASGAFGTQPRTLITPPIRYTRTLSGLTTYFQRPLRIPAGYAVEIWFKGDTAVGTVTAQLNYFFGD